MANNLSSPNISSNNGQRSSVLPPTHHKIWVTDDSICYLVGGKKATVRARSEAELQKLDGGSTCLVCSAPSNEHYYGARSCKNCSDFFKRSVLDRLDYICTMGGRCRLVVDSLDRACSACRLRKCIYNGMCIEHVRKEKSEEERRIAAATPSKPAAATTSSKLSLATEKRPMYVKTAVVNSTTSTTLSLADQVRDRITSSNRDAVHSAVTARDNVARDIQLFVNTLLNVGRDLINQIDGFMEQQLDADRERLKQLDDLEKNLKSNPNSTEATNKLSAFLKDNSSMSSMNLTYDPSKSTSDRAAISLLFNEPFVNESPLPPVRPTPSVATFPIVSTSPAGFASKSAAATRSSFIPIESQSSPEPTSSGSDVAQTSNVVASPTDTATACVSSPTEEANSDETAVAAEKAARKAAKRAAVNHSDDASTATVSGGGPASAKRKPPVEPPVVRDEPEETVDAQATKTSNPVRRIDSSDSEASTLPPDEKRIRMEQQFRKQERRRRREEDALRQQLESSPKETTPRATEETVSAQTEKHKRRKDKSDKKNKKYKQEKEKRKEIDKAKHAENRKENLQPSSSAVSDVVDGKKRKHDDKERKTKEHVTHTPNSSGDNRAMSSSHPSLKTKKDKSHAAKSPSEDSSTLLSDLEKSLLEQNGFKTTKVDLMHVDVDKAINRHNAEAVENAASSSKTDKNRDKSKATGAAVIHNFISTQKTTSPAADARSSPDSVTAALSEGSPKAISGSPEPSSAAGANERKKATSAQPKP